MTSNKLKSNLVKVAEAFVLFLIIIAALGIIVLLPGFISGLLRDFYNRSIFAPKVQPSLGDLEHNRTVLVHLVNGSTIITNDMNYYPGWGTVAIYDSWYYDWKDFSWKRTDRDSETKIEIPWTAITSVEILPVASGNFTKPSYGGG